MYDRRVKGKTLTLAVSGLLWEHSLVIIDRETRSLWSQLLGECMRGELVGRKLKPIPSIMTDWKSWRSRHPRTTVAVLSRTATEYRRDFHSSDKKLLIGLSIQGRSRAWRLTDLRAHPVVNDRLGDIGVLVVRDKTSGTMALHGRRIDRRDLTFEFRDGALVDRETQSTWDLITGRAVTGAFKGKRLPPLPGIVSYDHAWITFYPNSSYYKP